MPKNPCGLQLPQPQVTRSTDFDANIGWSAGDKSRLRSKPFITPPLSRECTEGGDPLTATRVGSRSHRNLMADAVSLIVFLCLG